VTALQDALVRVTHGALKASSVHRKQADHQFRLMCTVCVCVCCRPIEQFVAAKQQTAGIFAAAVCKAGWRLNCHAAAVVGGCRFNHLGPATCTNVRGILWGLAATLVEESTLSNVQGYRSSSSYRDAIVFTAAVTQSDQSVGHTSVCRTYSAAAAGSTGLPGVVVQVRLAWQV
jgi:hypothetical protein